MSEARPCPICGFDPVIESERSPMGFSARVVCYHERDEYAFTHFRAVATKPHIRDGEHENVEASVTDAIAAWNGRIV